MSNELVQYVGLEGRASLARMPEVVKALDRSERLILGASITKPVKDYTLEALAGELTKSLRWIARDIGYTIKGEDDWQYITVRTAQLLKRYYETLSVDDFRLAFEMAVAGELDSYLPKDRSGHADAGHYQQFSAEYVCKILNGYKAKRLTHAGCAGSYSIAGCITSIAGACRGYPRYKKCASMIYLPKRGLLTLSR